MLTARSSVIREMEKSAVASGIAEYELMLRAGIAAGRYIHRKYSSYSRFVVLCGGGNNGGDALVAAKYLFRKGHEVAVFSTREKNSFTGCAACSVRDLPEEIPFYFRKGVEKNDFFPGDVIIDGLLGIGFSGGRLREETANFIKTANESKLPVISFDLPSGIDADNGTAAENGAIKAVETLTFGRPKAGLFLNEGAVLRGSLRVIDIGLCGDDPEGVEVFTNIDAVKLIPEFPVESHKNSRGRVLVWGGSPEYPGAAALSAYSALKSGSGLVRVVSTAELSGRLCNAVIVERIPERTVPEKFFALSDVLICGCGWGRSAFSDGIRAALDFSGKVILDADALNYIAANPEVWKKSIDVILTPHPGEAARLMAAFGIIPSSDRMQNAQMLADKLGAVVVFKGYGTIVAAPDEKAVIIAAGNSLLATAGSGDVLTGVIGALAAQGMPVFEAASLGAYLHGIAAETAEKVLIADDLPELIAQVVINLQKNDLI